MSIFFHQVSTDINDVIKKLDFYWYFLFSSSKLLITVQQNTFVDCLFETCFLHFLSIEMLFKFLECFWVHFFYFCCLFSFCYIFLFCLISVLNLELWQKEPKCTAQYIITSLPVHCLTWADILYKVRINALQIRICFFLIKLSCFGFRDIIYWGCVMCCVNVCPDIYGWIHDVFK